MENINLLKKHKRKTILWHALVKFIFIYICILTFLFTSIYFRNYNENELLKNNLESILNIINTNNIDKENLLSNMGVDFFDSIYIVKEWYWVIHDVDYTVPEIKSYDEIFINWNYKYYSKILNLEWSKYHLTWRIISNNFVQEILVTIFVLILLWPFLYIFLYYISKKWLNKVYEPIEDMIHSLEDFALNINHEFKTSISEIISSLELADITKEYEHANKQALWSACRLNQILDSLSLMIHYVNSDYRKEKINIISELDNSIGDFSKYISEKRIKIDRQYDKSSSIIINIDKAPLILCFTNILKNAIKYSENDWTIEVYIWSNYFIIKDYWVGIEKINLDKIFNRHFRESYNVNWSGIWLSIVKKITDIYWWKVEISSEKNVYTSIKLIF